MNTSEYQAQLSSREYKLMLQPLMFGSKSAIGFFAEEFATAVKNCGAESTAKSHFTKSATRTIEFLDSQNQILRRNNFLLRHRYSEGQKAENELTLKCRAADPFVVFDTQIVNPKEKKGKSKLEEDICPPFISRLSRSLTLPVKKKLPKSVSDCFALFPGLGDHLPRGEDVPLMRVNNTLIHEQVFSGFTFTLCDQLTESALILWRHSPKGRIAIVEFSFRYKVDKRGVSRSTALSFVSLFAAIRAMDWASPTSMTKTKYLYGSTQEDT